MNEKICRRHKNVRKTGFCKKTKTDRLKFDLWMKKADFRGKARLRTRPDVLKSGGQENESKGQIAQATTSRKECEILSHRDVKKKEIA